MRALAAYRRARAPTRPRPAAGLSRWWTLAALAALAAGVVPAPVATQDGPAPRARVRLDPGPTVTVGQPLRVTVEVLVPSYFMGAPRFGDLVVPNALVLFNDRGANFSEREGGRTWAAQSRSYTVYPQVEGAYRADGLGVSVAFFDGGRTEATVTTGPVAFEAVLPAAARALSYFISTPRLTLTERYEPEPDTLRAGDAFTRTLTASVENALAMVIPPAAFEPVDGLSLYPDPPRVEDRGGERGETVVGTRTESVTVLAQSPGTYTLPAVELVWWDVTGRRLRTARLPERTFHVVPAPERTAVLELPPDSLAADEAATDPNARVDLRAALARWGPWILGVAVLLVVGARVRARLPEWRRAWSEASAARADTEGAHFRRFQAAARNGDPAATARTFMRWLDRRTPGPGPATYRAFAREAADPELERQAAGVGAAVYGAPDGPRPDWSGKELANRAARVRRHLDAPARAGPPPSAIPPLNRGDTEP